VIRQMMNAAYRPTSGGTPARNANATASGTNAKATVNPDKTSALGDPLIDERRSKILDFKGRKPGRRIVISDMRAKLSKMEPALAIKNREG
jgi:hypothetical protein